MRFGLLDVFVLRVAMQLSIEAEINMSLMVQKRCAWWLSNILGQITSKNRAKKVNVSCATTVGGRRSSSIFTIVDAREFHSRPNP